MATRVIGSGSTRNNSGTIATGSNVTFTGSRFTQLTSLQSQANTVSDAGNPSFIGSNGLRLPLQAAAAVVTTSIANASGFVRINKSSHGLANGNLVEVYGTNVAAYNTVHRITDAQSGYFITNIPYIGAASTAGSYVLLKGTVNVSDPTNFIAYVIGRKIAGIASTLMYSAANATQGQGLAYANGNYRSNITDWSFITGRATYGGSRGVLFGYNNADTGSPLAAEAQPSRAVPGKLVYKVGSSNVVDTYDAITG
jgi:hypothetical protein